MTSRSALDAQHGRQGGRIVSWDRQPPPPIGDPVRLDLGDAGNDVVIVIGHLDGRRIRVRFASGATLIVPITLITLERLRP